MQKLPERLSALADATTLLVITLLLHLQPGFWRTADRKAEKTTVCLPPLNAIGFPLRRKENRENCAFSR